jgi:hypothetical protein
MFSPPSTPAERRRAARAAWLAAFLLTLALLAGLGLARAGSAAPAAPKAPVAAPPFEAEEEECGAGEPECEGAGEGCEWAEDEELEECEGEAGDEGAAPPECLLASAQPQVAVSEPQQRLRLSVRYTVEAPVEVAVSLRASGARGGLTIAAEKHRLSRSGSFQDTTDLSPAETERALAAGEFTVRLRAIGVPWTCHRYDFRHLTVKRQGHGGAAFSESRSDLRSGR